MIVFSGPTLSRAEVAEALPSASWLPPAGQGDVFRAAQSRPNAIGIIDGYFDCVPAVWHKEILWALREGIAVYGAASMGALRAAELAAFGMTGVGQIYDDFASGRLDQDDEVAVAHGSAESEFRPISEAMVDIRATLLAAEHDDVLTAETSRHLELAAKSLWYPDRNYPRAVDGALARGASPRQLRAFGDWLPEGRVRQKRSDALSMLAVMADQEGNPQPDPDFELAWTDYTDAAMAEATAEGPIHARQSAEQSTLHQLLDELRLEPGAWQEELHRATLRLEAEAAAQRNGRRVTEDALVATVIEFRQRNGLHDPEVMADWLLQRGLTAADFARLMTEQTPTRWLIDRRQRDLPQAVLDHLVLHPRYPELRARAADKRQQLSSAHDAADISDEELSRYVTDRSGGVVPVDLEAHARDNGFTTVTDFRRAVAREFQYVARRAGRVDPQE